MYFIALLGYFRVDGDPTAIPTIAFLFSWQTWSMVQSWASVSSVDFGS